MFSARKEKLRTILWTAVKKTNSLTKTETDEAVAAIKEIATDTSEIYISSYTGKLIKTTVSKAIIEGPHFLTRNTPLVHASENGHLKIVKALVEAKADVNSTNSVGATPLNCSTYTRDDPEMVKMLLEAKADPDIDGPTMKTALKEALSHNHPNAAQVLLKYQETHKEEKKQEQIPQETQQQPVHKPVSTRRSLCRSM